MKLQPLAIQTHMHYITSFDSFISVGGWVGFVFIFILKIKQLTHRKEKKIRTMYS